jgi:hypothetical protein
LGPEASRRYRKTTSDYPEVNEASSWRNRQGILRPASLGDHRGGGRMPSSARRLSNMPVGLHSALVEGRPALPLEGVPAFGDASGHLRNDRCLI